MEDARHQTHLPAQPEAAVQTQEALGHGAARLPLAVLQAVIRQTPARGRQQRRKQWRDAAGEQTELSSWQPACLHVSLHQRHHFTHQFTHNQPTHTHWHEISHTHTHTHTCKHTHAYPHTCTQRIVWLVTTWNLIFQMKHTLLVSCINNIVKCFWKPKYQMKFLCLMLLWSMSTDLQRSHIKVCHKKTTYVMKSS